MAAPKRILTLSLGSQTLSLAEFLPLPKGGLKLNRVETRELLADPAADATRISQGALAIGEMADSLKAKKQDVRCALASHSSFSRLVKIPAFSADEFDKTVAFEAQQNIPYPLPEVSWDYKRVGDAPTGDPEVLIVAAKNEILEDWVGALANAKMSPSGMEMAPLALYNAFRFNYGEPEGCTLLLDLGSRTTNLIFIEPGNFYFRTISSGGNALSAAVAKEFAEPMMLAETRKRESGFIGRGANYADPEDPQVARLAKVLRNAATRLHAEVARSISFYRSQHGGAAPSRVFLCGGGVSLAFTREFWEEKLSLPVELFNPLRCIPVEPGREEEFALMAPRLGELVGLALESVTECPLTLNLLPAAILKRKRIMQQSVVTLVAAACVTSSLAVWGASVQKVTRAAEALRQQLTPKLQALEKLDQQIKKAQSELDEVHHSAAPYQKAIAERDFWNRLIQHLNSCLPEKYIWITNLEVIEADQTKNARPGTPGAPSSAPGSRNTPSPASATPSPKGAASSSQGSGSSASSASTAPGSPSGTAAASPKLLVKGLYLENPSGSRVVQNFKTKLGETNPFFTVPEIEKIEIIDRANPTEWAQSFTIPLQLIDYPGKSLKISP
jgi:type IV pilus assembly protein PilM